MSTQNRIRHTLGIVKIYERIELCEYDARLEDDYLTVWVNIDAATAAQWNTYKDEEATLRKLIAHTEHDSNPDAGTQIMAQVRRLEDLAVPFYAGLWDMPLEDARAFYLANQPLFTWCVQRSWDHINNYRSGLPKASGGGQPST